MVKSVLVQSTVLKEAISETNFTGPRLSYQSEDILVPATNTMEELIKNVEFINILTGRIAEHLLCNAEFQEALTFNIEHQMRGCTDKLKKKIDDLEVKLTKADNQLEQYSRRNCLVIHGISILEMKTVTTWLKNFFHSILESISKTPTLTGPIVFNVVKANTAAKKVQTTVQKPKMLILFTRKDHHLL